MYEFYSASDDGSRVHELTIAFSSSVPITSCCKSESISFLDDKRIAERFKITMVMINQRTNGPVNAHLLSWPSKAQNIQNLENIW